jgi:murein L,D-transpeptidase YafK
MHKINPVRFVPYLWLACGLLFLVSFVTPAVAELPSNLIISPKARPHYVIVVEKSAQRLLIYRFDGADYRLVTSYFCATGENSGDKEVSGDRKTPEGIYFFTKAVGEKYLTPIYGARAFPMDYPNLLDRRRGKDGDGIWVHGTNEELKARSTNGCVALFNEDIVHLDDYIRLWDTPIIIEQKLKYEKRHSLRTQGREFLEIVEGWREAWSGKELNRYLSYYANDFRWRNLDLQGWRQKKQRLNRLYKAISVQLSDIRFFRQGKTVTAIFDEVYRSDRFASHGLKRIYLVQNSRQWRILGEEWRKSSRPQPPPLLVTAKVQKKSEPPEDVLHRFVQKWRRAWERGDLPGYISCYHPGFKTLGMDLRSWNTYKKWLFERSSTRSVQVSDMSIRIKGSSAVVVFKQKYSSDNHQDYGLKTLRLRRRNGRWTIHRETWQPLPRRG